MILEVLVGVLVVVAMIQLVRLVFSDCDLTLQWAEKFGRSVDSLAGQVVWITGASSGIGEALAYRLAAAGCKLVLSARRSQELERVKKQCLLTGPVKEEDVLVLPLDSIKYDSHAPAVQTVLEHFGQIDVLVNNAGRSQRAKWVETKLEVDRAMLELNVLGVLSLTKCVLPHMIQKKKSHIVVMSSLAGKTGPPMSGSYNGSKHALHGWFEGLRLEGSEYDLDVTMICPGPVFSNFMKEAFTENPDEALGGSMDANEKRMSTERCAHLCAVAMANRLDEVWISRQPMLMLCYASQYLPSIFRSIFKRVGVKQMMKFRNAKQ